MTQDKQDRSVGQAAVLDVPSQQVIRDLGQDKFFLIGFSVLEGRVSPANYLQAWAQESHLNLKIFGFGGFHLTELPYLIDMISLQHDLRGGRMIIDPFSSNFRLYLHFDAIRFAFDEIVRRAQALNLSIGILNFCRRDVDHSDDRFFRFGREYFDALGVPSLDLGSGLHSYAACHGEGIEVYLRDTVHPTEKGAEFYAERIREFLLETCPIANASHIDADQPRLFTIPLRAVRGEDVLQGWRGKARHGLNLEFLPIGSDGLLLDLGSVRYVRGLFTIFGPQSGYLRAVSGGQERLVRCFDANSYYERLSYVHLNMDLQGGLRLESLLKERDVELLKGTWSTDRVTNFVSHIAAMR